MAVPEGAPQQTIKLSELTGQVVQGAYSSLKETLDALPSKSESERKKSLLQFVHTQKQKVLRLRMLVQWANKALAVNECAKAWGVAGGHSDTFRLAADHMAYLQEELCYSAVPAFDVSTAWDVLVKGQCPRLPAVIDEICPPKPLSPAERCQTLKRMDFRIMCSLDQRRPPREMRLMNVHQGVARFHSEGEYDVEITLAQPPENLAKLNKEPLMVQEAGNSQQEGSAKEAAQEDSNSKESSKGKVQKSKPVVQPGQWWWRLMSLKLLAASSKGPPIHPDHAELLKQEIDIRMCMAQEAEIVQAFNDRKASSKQAGTLKTAPKTQAAKNTVSKPGGSEGVAEAMKSKKRKRKSDKKRRKKAKAKAKDKDKDKELDPALKIVHEMLHEMSTRLVLNTVRNELRGLVRERTLWAGKLKLAVANHLKPGYRLYYWIGTPLVTDAMLQGARMREKICCARDGVKGDGHSPYLEFGTNHTGRVVVQHFPDVPVKHVKDPQDITLDPVDIDVELVLLRAAAVNSQIIIGVLCETLKRAAAANDDRKVVLNYWKDCIPRSDRGKKGCLALGPKDLGSPMLALYEGGDLILEVSFHMHDGCFVLEAGSSIRRNLGKQMLERLNVEEGHVNQSWKRWSQDVPVDPNANSTVLAFEKVAAKLWRIVGYLWGFVQLDVNFDIKYSAGQLGIQMSPFTLGPSLLDKYFAKHPECPIDRRKHLQLMVPGISLPKSFTHFTFSKNTKKEEPPKGIKGRLTPGMPVPHKVKDIRCYLNVNPDAKNKAHMLSMVMLGVDMWGLPVQIVNCIPVSKNEPDSDLDNSMSPDNHKERVPGGGKIKPRASRGKRKRASNELEDDDAGSKKAHRAEYLTEEGDNVDVVEEELCTENLLGSDDDVLLCDENGVPPLLQEEILSSPKPPEPSNPLFGVIQWCQRRLLWEHILLQLTGLDVPFVEEHHPSLTTGKCIRIVGWASPPPRPAKNTSQKSAGQKNNQSQSKNTHMWFGFEGLESILIRLPSSSEPGVWVVRIKSQILAQTCGAGLSQSSEETKFSLDENGLELEYSVHKGATMATALEDLLRIGYTQRFIASLNATMETTEHKASNVHLPSWTWPSLCNIHVERAGLSRLQFVVQPADSMGPQGSESVTPSSDSKASDGKMRYMVEWGPRSEGKQRVREMHVKDKNKESKAAKKKIRAAAKKKQNFFVTSRLGKDANNKKRKRADEELCSDEKIFRRAKMARLEKKHVENHKVTCRVKSEPEVPTALLEELCHMLNAGEHGLFLDAIGIISGSMLIMSQALSPEVMRAANLPLGAVTLAASSPPYGFKLLFSKGDKSIAMDIRLFSNGISYFGVNQSRFGAGGSPKALSSLQNNGSGDEVSSITLDMIQGLQRFVEEVRSIPGVQVSQELLGDGFRGPKLAGFGLWCRGNSMAWVLKKYIGTITHY